MTSSFCAASLRRIGRRYALVGGLTGLYLVSGVLLRLVLWASFGRDAAVPTDHIPAILLGGLVNDLVVALYLLTPLALYLTLASDRWHASRANRWLLTAGTALSTALLCFLAASEYFFFEEFSARFNIVSVDYLVYPTEVIGDIRAEYPVGWILAVCAMLALLLSPLILRQSRLGHATPTTPGYRYLAMTAWLAMVVAAVAWLPTDALSLSANRVGNELVQNGISGFFRAARTNEIDYHAYYKTATRRDNWRQLVAFLGREGGQFTRLSEGRLDRRYAGRSDGLGRQNIVVIVEESLGAEFSQQFGGTDDLTPNLDQLARAGLWFDEAYASGTRTVRGLEAITTSLPPIPTVSVLRRPGNEGIANWGAVMRGLGYHTSFLYGGYGYFDNMNYFYESNGFEVLDRNALDHEPRFENIWGVSDEDLFDLTLNHLDALSRSGQPFFTMVMTTSNHKPFTFREGIPGVPARGGGRRAGVRYADYALGYFMERAAQEAWFNDTLFVIVADHGARVYGAAEIPLKSYEIPLVIYAPGRIEPRRIAELTGQIDIAPTVLGLLGMSYEAPFFGRDVLNGGASDPVAFFSHNHDIAILAHDQLEILGLGGGASSWHYDRSADTYARSKMSEPVQNLGVAFYQTAYELFEQRSYR